MLAAIARAAEVLQRLRHWKAQKGWISYRNDGNQAPGVGVGGGVRIRFSGAAVTPIAGAGRARRGVERTRDTRRETRAQRRSLRQSGDVIVLQGDGRERFEIEWVLCGGGATSARRWRENRTTTTKAKPGGTPYTDGPGSRA